MHPDLTPATEMLAQVVADIGDHQLSAATPVSGATVADLLDHVDGFSMAFAAAAAKDLSVGSQPPSADGSRLGADWRTRIPGRLAQLAAAWHDARAWQGMTRAGGVDLPGDVAAAARQATRADRSRPRLAAGQQGLTGRGALGPAIPGPMPWHDRGPGRQQ